MCPFYCDEVQEQEIGVAGQPDLFTCSDPNSQYYCVKVRLSRNPMWRKRGVGDQTKTMQKRQAKTAIGSESKKLSQVIQWLYVGKNWMKSAVKPALCSVDQKPCRTRDCHYLSQWIYTTYFHPACCACSSLRLVLVQFPIATSWTKRDFSVGRLLWKISGLRSTASTSVHRFVKCWTFALSRSLSLVARKELWGVLGEEGGGRAGCCTSLLPWGFWRSDYAVVRLREWRISFREGDSGKKQKLFVSLSFNHQLCGGGIYFRKRVVKLYFDRKPGLASESFLVFSYYLTVSIKLRIGHHANG